MQDADREWIATVTGGVVVNAERTVQGGSRGTWLVDVDLPDGRRREIVLRRDTGTGPFAGTEFTLEREAAVYRALADTEVAIPGLVAVSPDGSALLAERVRGSDNFDAIRDDEERARVVDSFLQQLAALHRVDVAALDLPGFARPSTPEEHALQEIERWERIFAERIRRPVPLVRFALEWCRRHVPSTVDRTVLCWGDVGPGNFLHDDGRVSALLDWELAHLGDPMDDLAFFAARTNLLFEGRFGGLGDCLRRYTELAGIDVDMARLEFYEVLVLVKFLLSCLGALDNRAHSQMTGTTYLIVVAGTRKWLPEVMAGVLGIELEPTPLPEPGPETPRSEVLDIVCSELNDVVCPALSEPSVIARVMAMTVLVMRLQTEELIGAALDEAELDDLAELLGERPATVTEGLAALDTLVTVAGPERDEDLVRYFARNGDREAARWQAISYFFDKRIEQVDS